MVRRWIIAMACIMVAGTAYAKLVPCKDCTGLIERDAVQHFAQVELTKATQWQPKKEVNQDDMQWVALADLYASERRHTQELQLQLDSLTKRLEDAEERFQLYLPEKYKPAED